MSQTAAAPIRAALDFERTLVLSIEVSNKSWVLAAQVPGLPHTKAKRTVDADAEVVDGSHRWISCPRRCLGPQHRACDRRLRGRMDRLLVGTVAYASMRLKCTLSSLLACRSIVGCAAQNLTVLMRSCCFGHYSLGCEASRACARWFQIPDEADEDARRCVRERTELISERVGLTNRIALFWQRLACAITTRCSGTDIVAWPNCKLVLASRYLRTRMPRSRVCLLGWNWYSRRSLSWSVNVMPWWNQRTSDKASKMIQQLASLRGIGVQSATVLVREAFVRRFANGKALGSYAGLASSPYSSGGIDREQGIGKAGNRRVRTVMVELAWLWTRYQPAAAQVCWFRERVGSTGRRVRKIMVVALARKLLIALWRFVIDGVVPEGAVLKPAA